MAQSEASSLTFASIDGSSTLELRARALPYRPLTIGGRQRMEFTWYPGSPSATVQMLGPEEAPITMNGFWKDRFIGQQPLLSELNSTAVFYNNEPIRNVSDLVDIVDAMRRSGLAYKFTWDRLQRFGHISNFEVTWHNTHDAEWQLEFSVTAQEERAAARPQTNLATIQQISTQAQVNQDELETRLDILRLRQLNPLEQFLSAVAELDDLITGYANDVTRIANGVASAVMAPGNAARSLTATITSSVRSITATANTITNAAVDQYFFFAGGQDNSPIGSQVAAASAQQELGAVINNFRNATIFQRYDLQTQIQQEQTRSYLAQGNIDFRDISTQFYGTPDNWILLMRFNGYEDSKVSAGDLIWVPPDPNTGALGSGGDY